MLMAFTCTVDIGKILMAGFCLEKYSGKNVACNQMEFEYLYYIHKLATKICFDRNFWKENRLEYQLKKNVYTKKNANRDGDMYFWDLLCYCYMDTLLSILVWQSTIDRKSILCCCWLSKSYTVTLVRLLTHDWRLLLRPFKLVSITGTELWNIPPTRIHCNY